MNRASQANRTKNKDLTFVSWSPRKRRERGQAEKI